jgi:hypothetical protein
MVDQVTNFEVTQCPSWAASLGYMGVAAAVCLSNWGSAVRFLLFMIVSFVCMHASNSFSDSHRIR